MSSTELRPSRNSISLILPQYTNEAIRCHLDDNYEEVNAKSYGVINFPDNKSNRADFIRIPADASAERVKKLLVRRWCNGQPSLVISVTGGAKDFKMEPRLVNAFRRGLLKVAKTTSAWIITGGMNRGIMKLVGEVTQLNRDRSRPIHLIGIATWGCITDVDKLDGKGINIQYTKPTLAKKGLAPLDPNHTHFIFVDDGTTAKFGGEISFRARLEHALAGGYESAHRSNRNLDMAENSSSISEISSEEVPIVLLVFEGGPNTVRTVHEAVFLHQIPAVILEGTGRCCDLFSKAIRLYKEYQQNGTHEEEIKNKLRHELQDELVGLSEGERKKETIDHFELVYQCIHERPTFINIVNFKAKSSAEPDLDVAILKALLNAKSNRESSMNNETIKAKQFQLALAWNRIDMAKNYIMSNFQDFGQKEEFHQMFRNALRTNQTDFVKLFLDNGISLSAAFKSDPDLKFLYSDERTKYNDLTRAEIRSSSSMHRFVLREILGETYEINLRNASTSIDFDKELFLWSLIRGQTELNLLFWSRCKNKICAALIGVLIYRRRFRKDPNVSFSQIAEQFEDFAVQTLNRFYQDHSSTCLQAITRRIPAYGNITWLELAIAAEAKYFISQRAIQDVLNRIWFGRIDPKMSNNRIIFSTIFIVHSHSLIEGNQSKEVRSSSRSNTMTEKDKIKTDGTATPLLMKTIEEKSPSENSFVRRIKNTMAFFRTPYVKYLYHLYFHALFLLLFSYVILNNFFPLYDVDIEMCSPSIEPGRLKEMDNEEKNLTMKKSSYGSQRQHRPASAEILLAIWVFTLLSEEFRQLWSADARSMRAAFSEYLSVFWNQLDVIAIILFYVAFALRFTPSTECFCAARILLAVDLTIWFIRSLDLCAAVQQLGPKLVMISSMIRDLKVYMLMLTIFIFGFGVSLYSLIHGVQPASWHLPREIMNLAYWQMFGDLNTLDTFEQNYKPNGYVVFILTAVYMAIVSILLVNLLIAMFSNTFDRLQSHTDQIWKFQRYSLICEYLSRPSLPPPFILISHLWRGFLYIFCSKSKSEKNQQFYINHLNRITFKTRLDPITSDDIETIEDAIGDEVFHNFDTKNQPIDDENDLIDEQIRSSQDVLLKKVRTLENRMQQIVTQQSFMFEYLECLMDGLQTVGGENIRMPRRRFDRDLFDSPNDSSPDLRTTAARRNEQIVTSLTEDTDIFSPNRGE